MDKLAAFNAISTFIFDVDGVLTNSELIILESGQLLRKMNTRDGYALKKALEQGYRVVIITGGKSEGVIKRLEGLGITDIYAGISNKLEVYENYFQENDLTLEEVLYMGDDLPDYQVMKRVGLPVCPADAAHEIIQISNYVARRDGGKGCVREVIEKVMRLHEKWEE